MNDDQRFQRLEESAKDLTESVDSLADDLRRHEEGCRDNWAEQHRANEGIAAKMSAMMWIVLLGAGASLAALVRAALGG